MNVGLVIPWRPQPSRLYACEATLAKYSELLPGVPVYFGDTEDEIFNVSGARNKGCLDAIADGCDVLVISDADIFLEPYPLNKSIEKAASTQVVSIPYTDIMFLSQMGSDELIAGRETIHSIRQKARVMPNQVGGIFIMSSSTFGILNGWDERFVGWGFEDMALQEAHKAIFGVDFHRSYGVAASLFHEDRDKTNLDDNADRFKGYKELNLSKEQMIEHVKENRR